ncbi:hypothetical protein B0J11DRAFT_261653 [Dendryphion nanum]|uniref:Extracellular membrane protein CFEM domain-containing protein n=1 Tax=Dendryphion nanum TaxID=256645 RepID=A0A9P9IQ02_9PLEO|nr:hypothetical protein B0J11DRAFT_261653 [Dendryphion nanum]
MLHRILLLSTILTLLTSISATGTVSFDSSNGYKNLRACALRCYDGNRQGDNIARQISCDKPGIVYVPADNDCVCRSDLQENVVRYLSNCVSTYCSANQLDVSSATQVYKDYCNSAGYSAAAPKSVSAQATGVTSRPSEISGSMRTVASSSTPPETGAPVANPTNSNPPAAQGGSGLSLGGWIGIAAGVIGALAAVVGCYFKWKQSRK